jgi:hypothetical protein
MCDESHGGASSHQGCKRICRKKYAICPSSTTSIVFHECRVACFTRIYSGDARCSLSSLRDFWNRDGVDPGALAPGKELASLSGLEFRENVSVSMLRGGSLRSHCFARLSRIGCEIL